MTQRELKAVHGAMPFRPVKLHLADGDVLNVRHREFMARSPSGRTIIVFGEDDDMNIVNDSMIARIETSNGNGSREDHKRR